ncbi:hypothetical protein ACGFIK_05605 [Micromonospora sp. NPDC048871]|uniref:hypothetical protein n=1 Tax=unclassified Micromonospora TaxID=2617518 RepID=UPI002E10C57D|nr:hypothetical protein OIE53_04770 [Micromonospora sp. NBC_01739]
MTVRPSPGDLLRIDGRASVQFAGDRALTLRVVSVSDRHAYDGWVWLTGYVLSRRGNATTKREIYVQLAGLSAPRNRRRPARSADAVELVGRTEGRHDRPVQVGR